MATELIGSLLKAVYLKFVGQVLLSVFLTYRVELVLPHSLSESQRPTCDT